MATRGDIQFKPVKNPNKPGRAPKGCVWVKENGQLVRNDEGYIAFREMTAADRRKASPGRKRGRPKAETPLPQPEAAPAVLLKKRTYKELSYQQLEQVAVLLNELMEKQRESERRRLESELEEVQEKLRRLE